MNEHIKHDPANVPQEVKNQMFNKLFGDGKTQPPSDALAEVTWAACGPELLEAVKLAYRKHHLEDASIGWDELSEKLLGALCNAMGSEGYLEWVKPYRRTE